VFAISIFEPMFAQRTMQINHRGGRMPPILKLGRLGDAKRVEYGPLAHYFPLIGDGESPARTGIQVAAPGYVAPMHWHPYVELLFVVEGETEVWLQGGEAEPVRMAAGDCVMLPANVPHAFRTLGGTPMRLLGIHLSADRVVNYLDRETDANGYPVLDENLQPSLKTGL
jgi:mannose-6-phosphate isomerase-like protein (cupin superfamily)